MPHETRNDASKKEQAEYLLECARYRKALQKYLLEGELMGELSLEEPPPPIEAEWGGWQGKHPVKIPSVVTAVWQARDGNWALLAANLSPEPRKASYEFDVNARGLPAGAKRLRLTRVRPAGNEDLGEVDLKFRRSEALAPREILAIEILAQ